MGGAGAQYSQRSQESQWVSGLFSAHAVRAACGGQGFILPQRLGEKRRERSPIFLIMTSQGDGPQAQKGTPEM